MQIENDGLFQVESESVTTTFQRYSEYFKNTGRGLLMWSRLMLSTEYLWYNFSGLFNSNIIVLN